MRYQLDPKESISNILNNTPVKYPNHLCNLSKCCQSGHSTLTIIMELLTEFCAPTMTHFYLSQSEISISQKIHTRVYCFYHKSITSQILYIQPLIF